MAVEGRRACGYRKIGGLYLIGEKGGIACCKLPLALPVHKCSVCGLDHTVHQTRGWTWVDPRPLLAIKPCTQGTAIAGLYCPAMDPTQMGAQVGLIWIGTQYYPTKEAFLFEANRMGISRRIAALPRDFKLGETWVFLGHPKGVRNTPPVALSQLSDLAVDGDDPEPESWTPAIFRIFKPIRVEKIVTASELNDTVAMDKLREKGITPVAVPDSDPDHAKGSRLIPDADDSIDM